MIRRREFITLVGSAVAALPLAARAPRNRLARIAVWIGGAETDPQEDVGHCESVRMRSVNPWIPGPNGRHEVDYFRRRGCSPSRPSLSLIVKN
jgi:hypothetical protein